MQVSPDDLAREAQRLQRNYQFLSYGLTAAWVILVVYVLMMVSRHRKLQARDRQPEGHARRPAGG